jgi:two-component system response regulator ChvI
MIRALVVDDDDLFRESLSLNLADEGFEVQEFCDGPSALDYLANGGGADIVLLDLRMPQMTGLEVLRRLRRDGNTVPVVFLTVVRDDLYEEAALEGGAVDFVDKSRSFSILIKRISLITQGGKAVPDEEAEEAQELIRDKLNLRLDISRAFWDEKQVPLTFTEFNIVYLLASNSGQDVTYRQIYDLVRGEGFVAGEGAEGYRANVRGFIKRIRQKFRDVDDDFDRIDNYPGFGYRWLGDGE